MTHDLLIKLLWKLERDPPPFEGNDIKHPESLIRYMIKKHTKQGDKIFDPFTGLGTTMFVAEELKRIPFGIEAERQKYEWVAGQMENWTNLINDDAANSQNYNLPKMDLIITSPPYMPRHHKWNPLYGGDPKYAGYDKYLKRMRYIFGKLPAIMKKNTPLIVQADNLYHGKIFTSLVHDLQQCLSSDFVQIGENLILWDNPKEDNPHTHCLIFKKK